MSVLGFEDLRRHVGHKIEVAEYRFGEAQEAEIENVAVECHDCHEVLIDFDANEAINLP